MKSTLALLFSVALLATACGGDQPPPVAPSAAMPTPPSAAPVVRPPFYSPLPDESIRFDFPFHLSSDIYYVTDKGETRRRVVLEFLDGNASLAWNEVELAMAEAGYELRNPAEVGAGKGTFYKPDGSNIFINTTGGRPQKPSHPDAQGTVWISWRVTDVVVPVEPAAPETEEAAPASASQG